MKNNHFKKIKTISFSLIIIALMILFVYREKVFRNERSLYEEQIAEMNELLAQAEEVQKARAEEIQKIRAEEITPKAEAENIEEIVPEETSESDGRAWLAAERQLQVGDNIPVRYYIEQTQIALEDTDENVGTALYF